MGISQPIKDILSGTTGGVAQVLVGQPFDIVKVRLQTAPEGMYRGMSPASAASPLLLSDTYSAPGVLDCAKQILVKEGPIGFYKVCSPPCASPRPLY